MAPSYVQALRFVKRKHRRQFRADHVPAWDHLAHVSAVLSYALEKFKEGNSGERKIIAIAALGHDVLEDTTATKKEVEAIFGERGLELIEGMTNTWGDDHPKAYAAKMRKNEEAVRLVKLADLYDNITSVAFHFPSLGLKWTTSYFLPIVSPMWRAVRSTKFRRYPRTSRELITLVGASFALLEWEVKNAAVKSREG